MDLFALSNECAPFVHPSTMMAIIRTESSGNPFAIGVVGGRLERQPTSRGEAIATAKSLIGAGWNASFGLAQINKTNLAKYGLDLESVFDPCANLRAASALLVENFKRASVKTSDKQLALKLALSAYYSGNFKTGFDHGYVQKVIKNISSIAPATSTPPSGPSDATPALSHSVVEGKKRSRSSGVIPMNVKAVSTTNTKPLKYQSPQPYRFAHTRQYLSTN